MFSQVISNLNWLHIFVATLAYFMLGALWYSPVLFVKQWIKFHNINIDDPDAKKGVAQVFLMSFVCMFLAVTAIAICQHFFKTTTLLSGLKVGLFLSVFLCATAISIGYIYLKKPLSLFAIDCGYQIIGCSIAGAILGVWH